MGSELWLLVGVVLGVAAGYWIAQKKDRTVLRRVVQNLKQKTEELKKAAESVPKPKQED